MNKSLLSLAIIIAGGTGVAGGYFAATGDLAGLIAPAEANIESAEPAAETRRPLFWRNPMNPAITSPVFMKDEMGMDYIPVYADEEKPAKKEREVLIWRNPMNPAITSPTFMKDEMGMDYIPVYADEEEGGNDAPAGTVKIDPVTVQNIGVRTTQAEQRVLSRAVRGVGRIAFDERRLSRVHPKLEGWIERLRIANTGEAVKKGQILLDVYSPLLVASQQEYLLARKSWEELKASPYADIRDGAKSLMVSARERLEMLDMPEHQIREIERSGKPKKRVHIHSPFDGVVVHIGAREGQYITPKGELYQLADLSTIWTYVDVYEYELPWIRSGDEAEMRLAGLPGETFTGRVTYIYPYAEAKTRTIKVRLEFDNSDGRLKPDMFADVTIRAGKKVDAVVVPSEAIVRSGTREQLFVVRGPGKFEPRDVKLGESSDGWVQVLDGVKAGEEVVTSALFLIDSESKLREATAKMLEAAKADSEEAGAQDDDLSMAGMSLDDDMDMGSMSLDEPPATSTKPVEGLSHD